MKALELLKQNLNQVKINRDHLLHIVIDESIIQEHNEAIKELEILKLNIKCSIEEIEYALAKPEYATVYLNNALRFLKEGV